MTIKAVIFDLDGTITKPFLDFDAIRREMGFAVDAGPILELMEKMPHPQRARAEEVLLKHESRAAEESLLNEGATETLDALRRAGLHIGVLTRNKRQNALAVAKKHNLAFDAVVDRDDGPVKPHPYGVLRLCEHFGIDASETLVVGDFLYDLMSAKAAGATSVLIKNGKISQDMAKYADFVIASLDDVLTILDNITRSEGQKKE